jgi:hypothetical protein
MVSGVEGIMTKHIGLVVAGWFLVNNLVFGLGGEYGRLIDAAIFAVGMFFVIRHFRHSRLAMLMMAANWFVPFLMRLDRMTLTPTAMVWNVAYAALWVCGLVGVSHTTLRTTGTTASLRLS